MPAPQALIETAVSAEASAVAPDDLIVEEEEPTGISRMYWFDPLPWDTGIELGINGSSGTSESFSIRTGGYIKRESRFSKLDLSSYYNRTTNGGETTQNNAQFDVRNDWLLDEKSPWTLFGTRQRVLRRVPGVRLADQRATRASAIDSSTSRSST